jgi:two-component system KDP operon response regulator KdpE
LFPYVLFNINTMVRKYRILIVDDESRILFFLSTKLKELGFDVIAAGDGKTALEKLNSEEPDLVVLDVIMPGISGFEVLKELRRYSAIPVIILSARDEPIDKIKGLSLGADDYLQKPFNVDELIARIDAIRRRSQSEHEKDMTRHFTAGNLEIDCPGRSAKLSGKELQLTRVEWLLLSELAQNAGHIMLHEDLLTRIWGPEYRNDIHILRTWISRLRSKVEENPRKPQLIRNIPKTGYIMDKMA